MSTSNFRNDLVNLPEPQKTYLEILKVHNKEVPIANLLAFFFRNKNNHGLDDLFIKALLQTKYFELDVKNNPTSVGTLISQIESTEDQNKILNSIANVKVKTEVKTSESKDDNKRIDILIDTDKFVICIEFKINHKLNNPLESYIDHVNGEYGNSGKKIFYIILTPNKKEADVSNIDDYLEKNKIFKQVIFSHFIKNVKNMLPTEFEENKSFQYYDDFVQTIQNREIRYKRTLVLEELSALFDNLTIESKYHSNNKGGFIELKNNKNVLKIRINDKKFQIENWNSNKIILDRIGLNTSFDIIIETVKKHMNKS